MNVSVRTYEILILALSGATFSGYLSAIKFFTQGCVLTVPCPLFLGYPACYYGFAMFAVLSVIAFLWSIGKPLLSWIISISAFGTLFALYFTYKELDSVMQLFSHFSLLAIPSCVMGLTVYVAILVIALLERKNSV